MAWLYQTKWPTDAVIVKSFDYRPFPWRWRGGCPTLSAQKNKKENIPKLLSRYSGITKIYLVVYYRVVLSFITRFTFLKLRIRLGQQYVIGWKSQQAKLQLCAQCPGLWIEARMAVTLFCYKPSCFSYVDDRVHGLVSMRIPRFEHEKVGGFVTKQGHRQPRFYSKARALSAQLKNGLLLAGLHATWRPYWWTRTNAFQAGISLQ